MIHDPSLFTDLTDPSGSLRELYESTITNSPDLLPFISKKIYQSRLSNLRNHIKSCSSCPLHKFGRPVPLSGPYCGPGAIPNPRDPDSTPAKFASNQSKPASVAIVSPSPDREECRHGESLLGYSGRFFNQILSTLENPFTPASSILVNCCPAPPSRQISASEISSCRPRLEAQIDIIRPWLIIALGGQAIKSFHPGLSVTQDRGRFFRTVINNSLYWVLATWSPAYVQRAMKESSTAPSKNPTLLQFRADLQLACSAVWIAEQLGGEVVDGIMQIVPYQSDLPTSEPITYKPNPNPLNPHPEERTIYLTRNDTDTEFDRNFAAGYIDESLIP